MPAGATMTQEALLAEVEHLGHVLEAHEEALTKLGRGERLDGIPEARVYRDSIWACSRCGNKLGHYDREADVLRIKLKDYVVHAHVGMGGWLQCLCRFCGHVERAVDIPAEDAG